MSGSISMPPGGPMAGGPGPMAGGGMPQGQLPPQVLAMLMQAARAQGGPVQAQSGGPMQAAAPQMPGGPMASPAAQMPSQQQTPAPMPGGMSNKFGAMAQKGRFGDTQMAHMTPGEIAVPPQVQTPQVLATLQQAFKGVGADVRQFAAGSPFAAHNPDTGQQEFSIWSAILPVAGAVLGALAGGVGAGPGAAAGSAAGAATDAAATTAATEAASAGAGAAAGTAAGGIGASGGAAIGGALGGAAGGAIDHTGPLGMLAGAAGGGLGGYLGMGGGLDSLLGLGGSTAATGPTANAISSGTTLGAPAGDAGQAAMAARVAAGDSPAMMTAGALPAAAASSPAQLSMMQLLKGGMAAGTGAGMGQSLGGALQTQGSKPNTPPGFNQPLGPVNPGLMIGGRPAVSTPNFTGYNPYTSVTGSPYRFY